MLLGNMYASQLILFSLKKMDLNNLFCFQKILHPHNLCCFQCTLSFMSFPFSLNGSYTIQFLVLSIDCDGCIHLGWYIAAKIAFLEWKKENHLTEGPRLVFTLVIYTFNLFHAMVPFYRWFINTAYYDWENKKNFNIRFNCSFQFVFLDYSLLEWDSCVFTLKGH